MRRFLLLTVLGVLTWIFVVPSCDTTFGCEAAPVVAHADDGACPPSIEAASRDAAWAAGRFATIADEKVTTGLFYDEDGNEHVFVSGEKGDHYERAVRTLREVGATTSRVGTYPAASHVEVKVAAAMREADVEHGVLVINHPEGVCPGSVGLSCGEVIPLILPSGAFIAVWSPVEIVAGDRARRLVGESR